MRKRIFTELEKEKMVSLYVSGESTNFIKKELGIVPSVCLTFLRSQNIKIRTTSNSKNRIFYFNENYFEQINTRDKAYFFGLLLADGNNSKNAIRIELHAKDVKILELFKKYICYKGSLRNVKRLKNGKIINTVVLCLNSIKLANDAEKIGIVPCKTFKTVFPDINKNLENHFIRGYFDGDGSVYKIKDTWNINFTGNRPLIEKIKETLKNNILLGNTKIQNKGDKGICTYTVGGNIQTKNIASYLYKDCHDLFLERKKEKCDSINFKIYEKYCRICKNPVMAKGFCSKHYQANIYLNK